MYYERFLKRKNTIYLTADDFLRAAVEYFQWADDHPIKEEKLFHYQGSVTRADQDKLRAYTKKGLTIFLGIPSSRLESYRSRGGEWEEAVELIEDVIETQKFEGAAAGLLNSNIIIRDLGLSDKTEQTVRDVRDSAKEITDETTLREASEAYRNSL